MLDESLALSRPARAAPIPSTPFTGALGLVARRARGNEIVQLVFSASGKRNEVIEMTVVVPAIHAEISAQLRAFGELFRSQLHAALSSTAQAYIVAPNLRVSFSEIGVSLRRELATVSSRLDEMRSTISALILGRLDAVVCAPVREVLDVARLANGCKPIFPAFVPPEVFKIQHQFASRALLHIIIIPVER